MIGVEAVPFLCIFPSDGGIFDIVKDTQKYISASVLDVGAPFSRRSMRIYAIHAGCTIFPRGLIAHIFRMTDHPKI